MPNIHAHHDRHDPHARYLNLIRWARKRYTDRGGCLVLSIGPQPSPYTRIERAARDRLMRTLDTLHALGQ